MDKSKRRDKLDEDDEAPLAIARPKLSPDTLLESPISGPVSIPRSAKEAGEIEPILTVYELPDRIRTRTIRASRLFRVEHLVIHWDVLLSGAGYPEKEFSS